MDAAQDAAAARDKLLNQQAESEAELRALRAKTTRQAAAVAAAADAEERVTAAEAKCKAAHADTSSWQNQVWQMSAAEQSSAPSVAFCLWHTVAVTSELDLPHFSNIALLHSREALGCLNHYTSLKNKITCKNGRERRPTVLCRPVETSYLHRHLHLILLVL